MSPVIETMARQSAQLRDDVNRAPVFVPVPQPVAGGTGGEPPKEKTMADNRPMSKLRAKLLGLGGEEVTVKLGGDEYLLVAPSEKKAGQIQQAALKYSPKMGSDGQPERGADGKPTNAFDVNMDQVELKVRALQACLFDPTTRTKVFPDEELDLEQLRNEPVSALRRKLMDVAVGLLSPDLKEVEKNSSATPGASSSSV